MHRHGALQSIVTDVKYGTLDCVSCVPFTGNRNNTMSKVLRFVSLLTVCCESKLCPATRRVVWKTDCVTVVRLVRNCGSFKGAHLQRKHYSISKAAEILESWKEWYGKVDGRYQHEAILLFMESDSSWVDSGGPLLCLNLAFPLKYICTWTGRKIWGTIQTFTTISLFWYFI